MRVLYHDKFRNEEAEQQFGAQQVRAAKHVQWQVAVALVVAMKEPPQLVTMKWIIRGIQIKHNPPGCLGMDLEESVDKEPFHVTVTGNDLLVATLLVRSDRRQFESIQGTLSS